MRKCTICVVTVLLGLLAFSGAACKKKEATAKTPEEASFQLRMALDKAPQPVRTLYFDKVDNGIRYGKYADAIAALDQMISDPSLNEQQKKLATQLKDMLQANPGGPAHQ